MISELPWQSLGYADALERSAGITERERQQAAVIRHQSLVMKELIEDLNLTSRLEYSVQALRREPVHPAALLNQPRSPFVLGAFPGIPCRSRKERPFTAHRERKVQNVLFKKRHL